MHNKNAFKILIISVLKSIAKKLIIYYKNRIDDCFVIFYDAHGIIFISQNSSQNRVSGSFVYHKTFQFEFTF